MSHINELNETNQNPSNFLHVELTISEENEKPMLLAEAETDNEKLLKLTLTGGHISIETGQLDNGEVLYTPKKDQELAESELIPYVVDLMFLILEKLPLTKGKLSISSILSTDCCLLDDKEKLKLCKNELNKIDISSLNI